MKARASKRRMRRRRSSSHQLQPVEFGDTERWGITGTVHLVTSNYYEIVSLPHTRRLRTGDVHPKSNYVARIEGTSLNFVRITRAVATIQFIKIALYFKTTSIIIRRKDMEYKTDVHDNFKINCIRFVYHFPTDSKRQNFFCRFK